MYDESQNIYFPKNNGSLLSLAFWRSDISYLHHLFLEKEGLIRLQLSVISFFLQIPVKSVYSRLRLVICIILISHFNNKNITKRGRKPDVSQGMIVRNIGSAMGNLAQFKMIKIIRTLCSNINELKAILLQHIVQLFHIFMMFKCF